MGIPNSMRIYNTSLLTKSYTFLKSTNNWCTASLYSHFFLKYLTNAVYMIGSWRAALISRVMIPNNSSAYGVNLDSKMLDKILYVVGKNMAGLKFQNSFGPYAFESETPELHQ